MPALKRGVATPSALSQAIHTAARFNGEIFAGYANGDMIPVGSYRKS